jgi:hypothetical protein
MAGRIVRKLLYFMMAPTILHLYIYNLKGGVKWE